MASAATALSFFLGPHSFFKASLYRKVCWGLCLHSSEEDRTRLNLRYSSQRYSNRLWAGLPSWGSVEDAFGSRIHFATVIEN